MPDKTVETVSSENTGLCAWCGASLAGKRRQAKFCGARCRQTFHKQKAPRGIVKQVRRLARGRVSVIVHFDPIDAPRALELMPGQLAIVAEGEQ